MKLFDAHCHLQMPQFDADRESVLARMQMAEMGGVIPGVDLTTSKAAVELAEKYDFLWAAVGLHPNDNPAEEFDKDKFLELARHPKVVAIGECGLDYFRSGGTPEEKSTQKERFEAQIDLAAEVGKPLIIHCRNAHEDMLGILSEACARVPTLKTIIHFCTVSGELAQKYLDLGCYLSFPGPVTYTDMYDDSIRVAPFDRILSETDSPFAAPRPFRGKRNEPAYTVHIVEKMAQIKDISAGELSEKIVGNAKAVFSL